jgi:hypothetical protein
VKHHDQRNDFDDGRKSSRRKWEEEVKQPLCKKDEW